MSNIRLMHHFIVRPRFLEVALPVINLVITGVHQRMGVAFAQTPEGEVFVHMNDDRIPLAVEGNKHPVFGEHRLFVHSDQHLPVVGSTIAAEIKRGNKGLYAHWCPRNIWENASKRYEVVYTDDQNGESCEWQGTGILMLSLLYGSSFFSDGIIGRGKYGGVYHLFEIADYIDGLPLSTDPRLTPLLLPYGLMADFPSLLED